MSLAHKHLDVRISRRVLWIGRRSFPLHDAVRATLREVAPPRRAAVRNYAVTVPRWLVSATVVSAVTPALVSAVVTVAALAFFAVRTRHLVTFLRTPWHQLTIETPSTTTAVLTSDDPAVVVDLAFRVTDALVDPSTEITTRVTAAWPVP